MCDHDIEVAYLDCRSIPTQDGLKIEIMMKRKPGLLELRCRRPDHKDERRKALHGVLRFFQHIASARVTAQPTTILRSNGRAIKLRPRYRPKQRQQRRHAHPSPIQRLQRDLGSSPRDLWRGRSRALGLFAFGPEFWELPSPAVSFQHIPIHSF